MNWEILGIGETTDKEVITAAYRERLKETNPEENPKGFMALRQSYEEALEFAKSSAIGAEENRAREESLNPVEVWINKLETTYNDFEKRCSKEHWKDLLSEDVCNQIDTRREAELELIKFLGARRYLPNEILKLFGEVFLWKERQEELSEYFGASFISGLIEETEKEDALPYNLFYPGKDGNICDEYMELYFEISNSDSEECSDEIVRFKNLSETHPYGDALIYRIEALQGDEAALNSLKELSEKFPEDVIVLMELCGVLYRQKQFEETIQCARTIVALNEEAYIALRILAESLAELGNYKEAVDVLTELMDKPDISSAVRSQLGQLYRDWHSKLINDYLTIYNENPDDYDNAYELALAYLVSEQLDKAKDVVKSLPVGKPDLYGYHNANMLIYGIEENFDKALEHCNKLIKVIKELREDGTEKTGKRIKGLGNKLLKKANYLMLSGRKAEVEGTLEEAMAIEDCSTYEFAIAHMFAEKKYDKVIEYSNRLIQFMPGYRAGFFMSALAYYKTYRDSDAMVSLNEALRRDPWFLPAYLLRIRIFLRNEVYSDAASEIAELKEKGVENNLELSFYEAVLLGKEAGNTDECYRSLSHILEQIEASEESDEWYTDFYYELSRVMYEIFIVKVTKQDMPVDESKIDEIFKFLDKSLEYDNDNMDSLYLKGFLLSGINEEDLAREVFEKLIQNPRHGLGVENHLSEIYYNDITKYADKALQCFDAILEEYDEDLDTHFKAARCHFIKGEYEDAEKHLLNIVEQDEENNYIFAYIYLVKLYDVQNRFEEAMGWANKVIDLSADMEGDRKDYFDDKIKLLRRLNKPQEALTLLKQINQEYKSDIYNDFFEICMQFGRFREAEEYLSKFTSLLPCKERYAKALIKEQIFKGNYKKAEQLHKKYQKILSGEFDSICKIIFDILKGKNEFRVNYYKGITVSKPENIDAKVTYAYNLWVSNKKDEAGELAEEALAAYEAGKDKYSFCVPIKMHNKAEIAAILGDFDKARELSYQSGEIAPCIFCTYDECKDRYLVDARIEIIAGNYNKAIEIATEAYKRWPDDDDFVICMLDAKRLGCFAKK